MARTALNDAQLLELIHHNCETCLQLAANLQPKNGTCSADRQARAEQAARDNLQAHLDWQHPGMDPFAG